MVEDFRLTLISGQKEMTSWVVQLDTNKNEFEIGINHNILRVS